MGDTPIPLTNMQRYYAQRGDDALEAFKAGRWAECDSLCTELLSIPTLPILWRAQASLLMATKRDNTAITFARDALRFYNVLLEDKPDDEYFLNNKEEAQLLVDKAEEKLRKQEAGEEVSSDEDEDGDEGEDGEESSGKTPDDEDGRMEEELGGDEGKAVGEGLVAESDEGAVQGDGHGGR